MTDLNEMWAALEAYQPYAEKRGFGEAWKRMTTERTMDAAYAAAARAAAFAATVEAPWGPAWEAAAEAAKAAEAAECKGRAIGKIREAIAREDKT